jgi:flagellar assembly protein FliH
MANSSEWLGADAVPALTPPGWLALVGEPAGFRAGSPFDPPEPEAPECAPPPTTPPEPDPAEAALARAYADGEAAGRAAAEAEAEASAAHQRALRLTFRALDETALGVLADDLAETVAMLCERTLAGCAIDRDALLARCDAAAQRIGGAAETLTLQLHPDDIALIGEALDGWRVTAEPALERGTVLIEGADGAVSDGPAEWRRAIAAGLRG